LIDISKITLEEVQLVSKKSLISKSIDAHVYVNEKLNANTHVKTSNEKEFKLQNKEEAQQQEIKINNTLAEDLKQHRRNIDTIKEIKATPLFKASEKIELTTEQIVQTKQFKVEAKNPKAKADETLKLLLRGEKPTNTPMNTTADFSVATARVIAPNAVSEVSKSLEQFLHGPLEESSSKIDGLSTHKADSFEVKLNEAKQMIKYLSQDVKTAIEDYKSPFTRVKVQLNPAKMGEIDVTIISRGKNLHVSISSNAAAINTLAMNANELKAQLSTSGIQNATLNFNSSDSSSQQQTSQHQQNRQNGHQADEEYSYFDNEEQNEEILSSLEIVIPNYA
jgi:flagellar hook-length control protein FliK